MKTTHYLDFRCFCPFLFFLFFLSFFPSFLLFLFLKNWLFRLLCPWPGPASGPTPRRAALYVAAGCCTAPATGGLVSEGKAGKAGKAASRHAPRGAPGSPEEPQGAAQPSGHRPALYLPTNISNKVHIVSPRDSGVLAACCELCYAPSGFHISICGRQARAGDARCAGGKRYPIEEGVGDSLAGLAIQSLTHRCSSHPRKRRRGRQPTRSLDGTMGDLGSVTMSALCLFWH